MKQKIVVKVSMHDKKSRSKALKIAVSLSGVESAAITGQRKDQVEVVGDGTDATELTRLLRKKVAHAELVSVTEAKTELPKFEAVNPQPLPMAVWYPPAPPPYNCHTHCPSHDPFCNIM
ncbi:heavy metal-associated isoprenylated plant protein 46-like [Primulina huaijiensis]|uniref:heavy metal-associated isoprenylated plant protein 46-like n=1 Tax=Primulina huaijiensis TaxID=1492673 RepID=UPI003CC78B5E